MLSRTLPQVGLVVACLLVARADAGDAAQTGDLVVTVRAADVPLEDALVQARGREARTDASGQARLSVPAGKQSVTVSKPGFQEAAATTDVAAGSTTHLTVTVTPAREEEVIVTSVRSDRRIQDVPVRVEVVDREDIEEKALMTPGSVAMLLGETTGLRVQTTAPSLGAANVRIQGLRGRYSLLLSDGLPLYGAQGDSLSLLQVPPLDLGRVEIVKGAASALYGPAALGGVVNLVSLQPVARQRQLLVNATTQRGADFTGFLVEPAKGHWAWTLIGGLHGQTRRDVDDDGWTDLPGFARGVLRPRAFWNDGHGRSVFATFGLMAENRRGGTQPDATAPDGRPFPQDLDSRRLDGGTVASLPLGRVVLSVRASFTHRVDRRVFGDSVEHGRRRTAFGEAVVRGTWGAHGWVVGGAWQRDSFEAREQPALDYAFTTPGFFAQDEIQLTPRVILGVSARLDDHSRYGSIASPRVSLLYRPSPPWTMRASAGTGFFAPTPFLEETEETGLAGLVPLRALAAERARSASLDLGWAHEGFDVNATLYGSAIRNPLERRLLGPGRFEIVNAPDSVRTWGTEFLARYRGSGFEVLLTHAYTSSTEDDPSAPGRRDVPLTPRNVTTVNVLWQNERLGRVGIEAYYTGRQALEDSPYRATGRAYALFGALLERRFGRARLFVNLENVGNVRQTRWEPLLRPTRALDGRWTVDAWAPLDGFVANGGVRVGF